MRRISKFVAICVGLTGLLLSGAAQAQDPTPTVDASAGGTVATADSPVVRAAPGNFGMTFTFGGLANLNVGGIASYAGIQPKGPLFTEIGGRYVAKSIIIPFSVGLGIFNTTTTPPNNAASVSSTDFGLSASVGVYKWFRVWRRIAPYFGGLMRLAYVNPTGDMTYDIALAIGPVIGTEYFIFDRVSLYAQAQFLFGVDVTDPAVQIQFATLISGGGQMGLTFYF